jgi:oligopeptidase A
MPLATQNPLLSERAPTALPPFATIRPEDAEPAVDAALGENRAAVAVIAAMAADPSWEPTWETLLVPLEEVGDRLARVWGPVAHLFSVTNTGGWRAAYAASLPKVTSFTMDLSQDVSLFRAYERLAGSPLFESYSESRQKVIRDALRDFRLSGIALPEAEKGRFKTNALQLSALQAKFEENVIDSVQGWSKAVADERALAGMKATGKQTARQKAKERGQPGFLLTLDFPSYDAVVRYADERALRRELFEAYATRASDQGPLAGRFDNTPLIEQIMALRHEQARLLGFANFAELSLASKMAPSVQSVETFLLELSARVRSRAVSELDEVKAFAVKEGVRDFEPWDLAYYSDKVKAHRLGFSEDDLRPYFSASGVLRGLFALVERQFGVRMESVQGVETWHRDVTTYAVRDLNGLLMGLFYLDLYARQDKRAGAWMDECIGRRLTPHGVQTPSAYLTCNFGSAVEGSPALWTHAEVVTLFHEFGHALQHLLTRVDEAAASGIRGVAWDAVELPSQLMEQWCFEPECLRTFARHWETDAPIPDSLLQGLRASRAFHSGLATLRQIELALFDLRIHRDYQPGEGARVQATLDGVRKEVSVLLPPPFARMPQSFGHVFAGGYAAGYYSYKWAEVLASDAFAAFEEAGFAPEVGRRFRDTVLALGGSREAMDVFVEFRGRKPTIDALLRHIGLD